MATTNYRISTQDDLNAVFDSYSSGAQANPTGYQDLSGNDLSTKFAPYVGGAQAAPTGYAVENGDDISSVFAKAPLPFPILQTSIPGIGVTNTIASDGTNCVFSTQGSKPTGDPYSYLYWSVDFGDTLNIATISIDGGATYSNIQFFGCAAISGQYAVAMGRLTQAGTNNFYFSSDYGKSYTQSLTTGQTAVGSTAAIGTIGGSVMICLNGTNAVWTAFGYAVYYTTIDFTNNTATWTSSGLTRSNRYLYMAGTHVYCCHGQGNGWSYSLNSGNTFVQNASFTGLATISTTKVGENIYVGGASWRFWKLTNGPASAPAFLVQLEISNVFIFSIAGCQRTGSSDDFVMFYPEGRAGPYYSNNGGVTFQLASPNSVISTISLFANSIRIIAGTTSTTTGIYWGKNAYIT